MKQITFIILLFLTGSLYSQVESDELFLDYGIIKQGDNRVKEITLTNNNVFNETLLRIGADEREFDIKYSSRTFAPGEKIIIRIKYNPRTKGLKSYDLPIYFGKARPLNIKLTADVNYLEWEDYTPCPDFSRTDRTNNFSVVFKVVDSSNGDPIKNATVAIAEQGVQQAIWKTNKKGEIEKEVPLGYYSMLVRADGFSKSRKEGYINRRNRYFIFALDPLGEEIIDEVLVEKEALEIEHVVEIEEVPEKNIEHVVAEKEESNPEFSLNKYARNNVVFLIDVSTSMKKEDRLEILKASMIELLRMLRPEDRLSIITYASSTDVIMNSRPVTDKMSIEKVIKELQGKGLTAGGTGIKKAYSIAQKNFIEGGNNQVYLATDGAFNKGENDVSRFVRKQRKKGVFMSIIAVKSPKWTIPKMQEICKQSNGQYIPIEDLEMDKEKIKTAVKDQSRKSHN
ncbi:MAG: VWA domain-containing protein [Flavobacteriales bacterium]|nr:VWA domain-containing protein [Flavobacteriales bacterium]